MDYKKYILSIKKLILISFLIFIFFILNGYFIGKASPDEANLIFDSLEEALGPILKMNSLSQFLFIFLNNSLTAFLVIILGIFLGIFPFLVLASNGFLLGVLAYIFKIDFSLTLFFTGIIPHGIIEIPAIIIASAIGFKLGRLFLLRILKKENNLKQELNLALIFFLKVLFPFFALAAFIEVFITAQLL